MKRTVFGWMAIVFMMAVMGTNGWAKGKPESGDQSSSAKEASRADIKWDNDTNGLLFLHNSLKEPLVLFAGAVNNRNILGGIRAESDRRIDFYGKMQEQSGTFLLRAVKESVYRSEGSLIESKDVVYAQVITYDKKEAKAIQLDIDMRLGADSFVVIENFTQMALEVRLNSPRSETLTALGPIEMNKQVYLDIDPNGYVFYPVFKYYDDKNDVIQAVEPKGRGNGFLMNPAIPGPGVSTPVIQFRDEDLLKNLNFTFCTIIVRNEAEQGIYLQEGRNRVMNQNHTNVVNPGRAVYNIYLGDNAQTMAYNIGYSDQEIAVQEYRYEPGKTYEIRFTRDKRPIVTPLGDYSVNNLSINLLNQR
ncbi:hypothetical protein FACS1894137_12420 [Spirochaetia bacterium]|nr:hypothetical protein FACS1894137_12420 [Spirochaetia bacterium]